MDRHAPTLEISRRALLTTTSAALVSAMLGRGVAHQSEDAQRQPKRGGTLQFGARADTAGLDSHRHNQLHTSHPTAALYTGLTDIDQQGNIVPGIAESWEPNQPLTAWVFRLRQGVLFHNGREVDAEAVKLNILRIKDPAIGTDWHRGTVENIDSVDVLDRYTVRLNLRVPDVALPANVMHYPTNLQAPDAFDSASEHPIGTGPFKFVSWTRWQETRLVRFENYWETDAAGYNLPYLDAIIGKPKREDSVRLTALRTGQAHLIEAIAFADVERFTKNSEDKYHLWPTHFGGLAMVFNFRRGPFQDKRLRTAAAYAIDRQAIHNAVFYGQGDMLDQPYPRRSFWHLESRSLEYDPDRAKALLRQARAVGTALKLVCSANVAYNQQTAQVVQAMWNSVGFKVTVEPLDTVPLLKARTQGEFDGLMGGNTYRFDPDGFFERNLHSKSDLTQSLSGWRNERYDQLVEEAKRTREPARRKELYTAAWHIVNDELPHFHLHEVVFTSAAVKDLHGYQPNVVGAFTYRGGGMRTASIGV